MQQADPQFKLLNILWFMLHFFFTFFGNTFKQALQITQLQKELVYLSSTEAKEKTIYLPLLTIFCELRAGRMRARRPSLLLLVIPGLPRTSCCFPWWLEIVFSAQQDLHFSLLLRCSTNWVWSSNEDIKKSLTYMGPAQMWHIKFQK